MRKTAAYAFHHSIPILIGFFPVGIAYGLLMQQAGYNFLWSGACSLFVLAGSLQFLMVTFFAGGVSLATVAVLALLLNSRHIFYGLSFIDKFRSFGPWRWFLIYSLCDENYALLARFRPRRQREVGLRAHGRIRDVLLGGAVHARRARRLAHPI